MPNQQDVAVGINISIIPEGFVNITNVTAVPGTVPYNGSSTVTAYLTNTGASDTIYCDFWVNGALESHQTSTLMTWNPVWTISNITATKVVVVRAGHYIYPNNPHEDEVWPAINITVGQGQAAFLSGPTYPASVSQGETANIVYTVINNGQDDTIWGGLYDSPAATVPITGTYWETPLTNGANTGQITISIVVTDPIVGWELRIGHYQE